MMQQNSSSMLHRYSCNPLYMLYVWTLFDVYECNQIRMHIWGENAFACIGILLFTHASQT